jgi:hypothetical protein
MRAPHKNVSSCSIGRGLLSVRTARPIRTGSKITAMAITRTVVHIPGRYPSRAGGEWIVRRSRVAKIVAAERSVKRLSHRGVYPSATASPPRIRAHSEIKPMSDTAAATTQRWQSRARNSKLPVTLLGTCCRARRQAIFRIDQFHMTGCAAVRRTRRFCRRMKPVGRQPIPPLSTVNAGLQRTTRKLTGITDSGRRSLVSTSQYCSHLTQEHQMSQQFPLATAVFWQPVEASVIAVRPARV